MTRIVRILCRFDDASEAQALVEEVRRTGLDLTAELALTKREFIARLRSPPDLILVEHAPPRANACFALRWTRKHDIKVPILVISSQPGEEVAVALMRQGAADYLLRDRLERLGEAIRQALVPKPSSHPNEGAWLASVVAHSDDAILTRTLDGTVMSWNGAAERLFGYRAEEMIGHFRSQFLPSDRVEELRTATQRIVRGESVPPFDTVRIHKSGRPVEVSISLSPLRDDLGRVVGVATTARDLTALLQTREGLRTTRTFLDQLLEYAPACIDLLQPDGTFLYVNRAWEEFVGLRCDQVVGRKVDELFPPEIARLAEEVNREVVQTGASLHRELSVQRTDGTHWFKYVKFPIHDRAGTVAAIGGYSFEITHQKRTEGELRHQQEVLQTIFDNVPVMLAVLSPQGEIQVANPCWQKTTGWSPDDASTRDLLSEMYPDPDERRRVWEFILHPPPGWGEFRLRTREGRFLDTVWANVLLEDGSNVGIGIDLTQQRRVDRALDESRRRLQALFDNARDAYLLADDAGRFMNANPAACTLLGYTREELLRLSVQDIAPLREPAAELWTEFLARGTLEGEFTVQRKDGSLRTIEYRAVANILPGLHLSSSRDITDRKRAEADRERLHREVVAGRELMEILSRRLLEAQETERRNLARELHDEIGQILTTVHLNLEALRSGLTPALLPRLDEAVSVVDRAVNQVRTLSMDLRPTTLDLLGLEPALRAFLARQAERAGLRLEFHSSLGDRRLPAELETVCFRIAQEAATNVVRHARATHIRVELDETATELHLLVSDDGQGFDVRAARRGVVRGVGFGLLSMEERALLFGGRIEYDALPGQGTRVRATLPLVGLKKTAVGEES